MKKILIISALAILSVQLTKAQNNPMVHFPDLHPNGTSVAFSFQGDIWVMDLESAKPQRYTIHEAYESNPKWSPDGSMIAFESERMGNTDIFVTTAEGGLPRQLTHHTTKDELTGWHNNKTILFNTERVFNQVEWDPEIQTISAQGGTPERLMDAFGYDATTSPDGRFIAFTMGSCRIAREAYQGPANRDIWLYDLQKMTYHRITEFQGNDHSPRWVGNDELYFLSSRSGRYNIYRVKVNDEGEKDGLPQALTSFTDTGIVSFSARKDANAMVFEQGASIFQMKKNGEPEALPINLPSDYRFNPIEKKTYTNDLDEFAVSPNENLIAFVVRGEVFVTENDEKEERSKRITNTPARERNPQWINDSTLIYLSDRYGQNEIVMARSGDAEESDLFKTLKITEKRITNTSEEEFDLLVSPLGDKISFRRNRGELWIANISGSGQLVNPVQLLDGWDIPGRVAWSPDGKWLSYALSDLNFNSEVYIHDVENKLGPVNISLHPKYDFNPVWGPQGKKLAFLSQRNNGDTDIWFVWLSKKDWEKTKLDWREEDEEGENGGEKDKGKDEKAPVEVVIDFGNIHERLVQATALPGNEGDLAISQDGDFFYFSAYEGWRWSYRDAEVDLYKIKWDGSELKRLTQNKSEPQGLILGPKGKMIYYISDKSRSLNQLNLKDDKVGSLPFKANMTINHPEERDQIFMQAWRDLKAGFYDPGFHGRDWEALKNKYKPWAMQASTIQDFRRIVNQMLGQLNASHMGIRRGEKPEDLPQESTGLLGVEIKPMDDGVEVQYVLPNSPADREVSKLQTGDLIVGINGTPVTSKVNFYSLLNDRIDEKIYLEIDRGGNKQEVVIQPEKTLWVQRYQAWVKSRREVVENASNGQLGYLHIQGMNWNSFERFERALTAAGLNKKGIVIDVRYNGGGWTTDYLMAVLNVEQHAYTIPRGAALSLEDENEKFKENYPFGERLPLASWLKPSIALCNANSYSNAEIFSHAYKNLDIGTLVGQPTFGAVISTGASSLIDASYVRMPFRAWYVKATEKNMEGGPAVPDITLLNPPDYRSGKDEQLLKAVEELLQQIE